jgi:hypothetical protein
MTTGKTDGSRARLAPVGMTGPSCRQAVDKSQFNAEFLVFAGSQAHAKIDAVSCSVRL